MTNFNSNPRTVQVRIHLRQRKERDALIKKAMTVIDGGIGGAALTERIVKQVFTNSTPQAFAQCSTSISDPISDITTNNKKSSIPQIQPISLEKNLALSLLTATCSIGLLTFFILPTFSAYAFDLDAGIKAVVDPFAKGIVDHYGKAILILGAGGAIIANGDLRTRAYGFGIGSGLAGAAVLAVKATLGIA